jgi:hypothetical protein
MSDYATGQPDGRGTPAAKAAAKAQFQFAGLKACATQIEEVFPACKTSQGGPPTTPTEQNRISGIHRVEQGFSPADSFAAENGALTPEVGTPAAKADGKA